MNKCDSRIYQISNFHESLDSTSTTSPNLVRLLHIVQLPMDKKEKFKESLCVLEENKIGTFISGNLKELVFHSQINES